MYAAKGVGLAAPQVGVNKRLMVFNPGELRRSMCAHFRAPHDVLLRRMLKLNSGHHA